MVRVDRSPRIPASVGVLINHAASTLSRWRSYLSRASTNTISLAARLLPCIWPADRRDIKIKLFAGAAVMVFAKLTTVAVPVTVKWAVDGLVQTTGASDSNSTWLSWMVLAPMLSYAALRVLIVASTQLQNRISAEVGMHAVRRVAVLTFEQLHRQSVRFHLERKLGNVTRSLECGYKAIENIIQAAIVQFLPTVLEITLVASFLAAQFSLRYIAVILTTILLFLVLTVIGSEWRIKLRRITLDRDYQAHDVAMDSLLNYEAVKLSSAEHYEERRYDGAIRGYEKASLGAELSLTTVNAAQAALFISGLMIAMLMSASSIRAGGATVGQFVMLNVLMLQLSLSLNYFSMVYYDIRSSMIDIAAMFAALGDVPDIADCPNAKPLVVLDGTVKFQDVAFTYDANHRALNGITFEIPAGKKVALVGPSGAGKSTVSRLLLRLYDVDHGRILIDNQDIRSVTQASLRAAIGIVPQDVVLFNDTIQYNVRYGRWDAIDTDVKEAIRLAKLDCLIDSSPEGYETEVGERGLKLSRGEMQRLGIARVLLKGPRILILDEATSALDGLVESEIQKSIRLMSRNCTTLIISHRLSAIVDADEIIVLDNGKIAERGGHHLLLAAGGLYADMWRQELKIDCIR
jgi:ATP-binding cassette subfamily B protein